MASSHTQLQKSDEHHFSKCGLCCSHLSLNTFPLLLTPSVETQTLTSETATISLHRQENTQYNQHAQVSGQILRLSSEMRQTGRQADRQTRLWSHGHAQAKRDSPASLRRPPCLETFPGHIHKDKLQGSVHRDVCVCVLAGMRTHVLMHLTATIGFLSHISSIFTCICAHVCASMYSHIFTRLPLCLQRHSKGA
jgi:hypothetical protein